MAIPLETENSAASILARAIDQGNWDMSGDAARSILAIELSPTDRDRMDVLAEKARSGMLSADEELEIDNYRQVACLVELMKSKARVFLKKSGLFP